MQENSLEIVSQLAFYSGVDYKDMDQILNYLPGQPNEIECKNNCLEQNIFVYFCNKKFHNA